MNPSAYQPSTLLRSFLVLAAALFCARPLVTLAEQPIPQPLSLRARVTAMTPEQRVRIFWTWGGSGLGGDVVSGELTAVLPTKPTIDLAGAEDKNDLLDELDRDDKKKPSKQEGKLFDYLWLQRGEWSPWVPLSAIKGYFVTFTLEMFC